MRRMGHGCAQINAARMRTVAGISRRLYFSAAHQWKTRQRRAALQGIGKFDGCAGNSVDWGTNQYGKCNKMTLLRFIAAIAIGLVAAPFTHGDDKVSVRGIFWMIVALCRPRRAPPWKRESRLDFCQNCPIFYSPLRTCGSPLRWRDRDIGCWCQLDVKAGLPNATCWLRDKGVDRGGWPDNL